MGMMLVNVTGLSLGIGFAGALAPFVSQDYGMGVTRRNGLHFRNFAICASIIFVVSCVAAYNADVLLVFLGQDPAVAECVYRYARVGVWALPGQIFVKGVQQVLDSQRDVMPGLVADVLGALLKFPLCLALLLAGGGFVCVAYAQVVTSVVVGYLGIYVFATGRAGCVWSSPRDEPPAPMSLFLAQALPNTFACCVEWWAQEVMAIFSGMLPSASVMIASQGVLFQSAAIFYMVWVGAKGAMGTRVGNIIGNGRPDQVPQAIAMGTAVSTIELLLVVGLGWVFRRCAVGAFTSHHHVIDVALGTWSTMLFVLVPYSYTFVLFGVLSGAGRQKLCAYVFFASVTVGLPASAYLSLVVGLGLDGLWLGNALVFIIAGLTLHIVTLRTDWRAMQKLDGYLLVQEAENGS
eukprot:CAMPEP_0117466798 /NCGR_PEP_ID=MMETSP0784-20121206/5327_1 /TAXON_ID=39447 /ORGANISM="" /LENGTH=405 /DNA_ID=CAMNT_0005260749 /DNA_START=321 /DNA_END=1538 /DNA_ORIENTATION=+